MVGKIAAWLGRQIVGMLAILGAVVVFILLQSAGVFGGKEKAPGVPVGPGLLPAVSVSAGGGLEKADMVPVVGGCGCDAGQWCDAAGGGWYCLRADGTKKLSGK